MSEPKGPHPIAVDGCIELRRGSKPVAVLQANGVRASLSFASTEALRATLLALGPRPQRKARIKTVSAFLARSRLGLQMELADVTFLSSHPGQQRGTLASLLGLPPGLKPVRLAWALLRAGRKVSADHSPAP